MAAISLGSVEQKLAKALLAAGQMNLQKTHNELALELGSAREVVSRHLKRFESYGWLTLSRGAILNIDFKALQDIIHSAESH